MAYYKVCPKCGANLDPTEVCDCEVESTALPERKNGSFEELRQLINANFNSEEYDICVRLQEGA